MATLGTQSQKGDVAHFVCPFAKGDKNATNNATLGTQSQKSNVAHCTLRLPFYKCPQKCDKNAHKNAPSDATINDGKSAYNHVKCYTLLF